MLNLFSPRTNKQLLSLAEASLGINIPNVAVCNGHTSPFDFVSDSFFERTLDSLVIGPRTGGKTINSAALEFLEASKKDNCSSCHLGAIMAQAKRAYKYVSKWANKFYDEVGIEKLTQEQTVFANGSEIEIVPGTINGVNSPHPNKATIDEFELLPWDIFQEACSMPKSSDKVMSALRLLTSRKFSNGNAQKMITESTDRGFKIYKWCVFEVLKRCTKKDCCDCEKYVKFDRFGQPHTWRTVCGGKAKQSNGYLPIKDAISRFLTLDYEGFLAQWLCERPEKSDSVFTEFIYDEHVIDDYEIDKSASFGRGWDFGYDDPTAVLFFQVLPDGTCVQFEELILSGYLIEDIADKVNMISEKLAPKEKWVDWGDPSGNARTGIDGYSYIAKLANKKIYVNSQCAGVTDGIQAVKKKLTKSSFTGYPEFYITKNCKKTIDALELAQWERTQGKIVYSKEKYKHDEHSHPLDGLRYFITGVFTANEVTVS